MTSRRRRIRGTVFLRTAAVVLVAGIVPLALVTIAAAILVRNDKEAALVDTAVSVTEARRQGIERHVELARAELRTVSFAAMAGRLLAVPDLVSPPLVAVTCKRDGQVLVEASTQEGTSSTLHQADARGAPDETIVDHHFLLLRGRTGGTDTAGLLDLRPLLAVPEGWHADIVRTGAASTPARGRPESVLAHRERRHGREVITASARTAAGRLELRAPVAPARIAAYAIVRRTAQLGLLALLPLALLALLLARRITSPVRALVAAVQSSRDAPVRPPALHDDEIGDLGAAIASMSERLHEDARVLRHAVRFSRKVGALGAPEQVLPALSHALEGAFPDHGFRVVPIDALESPGPPTDLPVAAARIVKMLDRAAAGTLGTGKETERATTAQVETHLVGDRACVLLAAAGNRYGVALSAVPLAETSIRLVEILCGVAIAAIERAKLHQAVLVNEKLTLLGRVTAGVAHEMNNPLAFVNMNLRVLEDSLDGDLRQMATEAREGTDRLARIVDDLSSVSKGGAQVRADEDLTDIARMTVRMVSASRPGVLVRLEAERGIIVACDRGRIEQTLSNLVANAADACAGRESAEVIVRVGWMEGRAWAEVRDNGSGVPEHAVEHLFAPFFTTKGSHGTGLGLYLSQSFAQAHGGDLELVSTGPAGTTFRLWLPGGRVASAIDASAPIGHDDQAVAPHAERRERRVLVLDDEPALVRAMQRWLGRRVHVTGTTDPREALELAATGEFSLVLCDLNMPAMSGSEFVAALRERCPDAADKVVIMTGSERPITGIRVLTKPVRPSAIEALLHGM